MIFKAKAPVRLELGGGGTDMPPFDQDNGGLVINATINYYSYVSIEPKDKGYNLISTNYNQEVTFNSLDDIQYDGNLDLMKAACKLIRPDPMTLTLSSNIPPNSGLGNSASASVAMVGALDRYNRNCRTLSEIAEAAFQMEEEINNFGGRQDQYAAAFGGINHMSFNGENFVIVDPVQLADETKENLQNNLVLAYIGKRGESGDIVGDQAKTYNNPKQKILLSNLKDKAKEMYRSLMLNKLKQFGHSLTEEWRIKTSLNPNITNLEIERLLKLGLDNGAIGGRLMGAGKGGHLIFYVTQNNKINLEKNLEKEGLEIKPFSFEDKGLQIWEI